MVWTLAVPSGSSVGPYQQSPTGRADANPCNLRTAEPARIKLSQDTNIHGLNRYPKVSFEVGEDGAVSNVNVTKGTGSSKIDKVIVDQVRRWKFAASPGCGVREVSTSLIIDVR